jgi:tetratricopeptide (TPR) repeat protein
LDVPATIAELTGIELAEGVEGESLLRPAAADRVLVAMSWAPLEQMGWLPLRAARLGSWRRVEGIEPRSFRENDESRPGEDDPDTQARLIDALAARAQVTPARVNLEEVRPWLESQGLQAQPVAAAGRAFGTLEQRREVARLVILGRIRTRTQAFRQANALMVRALKVDAQNYAVLLHRGQLLTFMEAKKAGEATRETVRLYPDRFDALHWLAHADWTEGWAEAEKLLTAILPYRPNDMDVLYDIACARSLAGDLPAAEEHLRAAIEAGYRQWNSIEIDPDLRNLRETPRYAELLREYGR